MYPVRTLLHGFAFRSPHVRGHLAPFDGTLEKVHS